MPTYKLNFLKIIKLCTKSSFLPLFIGGSFSIGYIATKKIFISVISNQQSNQQNLNILEKNKDFSDRTKALSKRNNKRNNALTTTQRSPEDQLKKIIELPISDGTSQRLIINYSQRENSQKQAVYKKNHSFFKKESVNSLMRSLNNTKKTNLLK